jgi:hypothetical protein
MRAVARLLWSYFTGTLLSRAFTIGSLVLFLIAFYVLSTRAKAGEMVWVAVLGHIALFIGGSLMALMFGRLASSHAIRVLPYGRIKLLVSAFITVVLVSMPSALISPLAYVAGSSGSLGDLLKYPKLLDYSIQMALALWTGAILLTGWLYLAIWFITSQRNMVGFFKGLLVVVILMSVPPREIDDLRLLIAWQVLQIAVVWVVFSAGFLLWPRLKAAFARRRHLRFARAASTTRKVAGHEFHLMLGTGNPWLLVGALALPVFFAARFVDQSPAVWLYFLTMFSTVAGAFAGQAAERSRALWLRGDWSREALFAQVERSYWRHNGHGLAALLVLMIAIGLYSNFPGRLLAIGLPLLALGTVLSTYLGLMITRGLGWFEAVLGVVVMVGLMVVAMLAARQRVSVTSVVGVEAALAVLALVLRAETRRRWARIDWMLCRTERVMARRGA